MPQEPPVETGMTRRADHSAAIDPDPFTIALGLFSAAVGGGAFLEARRQRQEVEAHRRGEFRSTWYESRRTLIHFKRNTDEFENYVMEEAFGRKAFRFGAVRLYVDQGRHHSLRRLRGQVMTTATILGDNLDDLSNYLGPEDRPQVDRIHETLTEIGIPDSYSDVVKAARTAASLYAELLEIVDEREAFTQLPDVS